MLVREVKEYKQTHRKYCCIQSACNHTFHELEKESSERVISIKYKVKASYITYVESRL